MQCIRPGQGPACVITTYVGYVCLPLCTCVCACVNEGMMISCGCSMSLSTFRAEADVLVGQNWRLLLPCVRITRWPLFPGTARQIHPQKKWTSKEQWTSNYKHYCQMYKREKSICPYPARKGCRTVLNRSAAVSSNLSDSRERWKKTLLNNLLCISGRQDITWG